MAWPPYTLEHPSMHMSSETLLVIVVVGVIAGWLAGQIVQGTGFGLVGDLVIGIIGAFIGSWLLPQLNVHLGAGIVSAIANATIGAIILLLLLEPFMALAALVDAVGEGVGTRLLFAITPSPGGARRPIAASHEAWLSSACAAQPLAVCAASSRGQGPCKERRTMAAKAKAPFDVKSILAKVGEGRSIGKYRKDQIVFSQGEPADAVFYIQKGKVKITVVSPQGKEAVVAILGSDDFFGEGCLAGQPRRMATVAAMTDSAIMRLEKATIVMRSAPRRAGVFRDVHGSPSGAHHPRRGGPGRSAVQFE